jgi:hypothetical protein
LPALESGFGGVAYPLGQVLFTFWMQSTQPSTDGPPGVTKTL